MLQIVKEAVARNSLLICNDKKIFKVSVHATKAHRGSKGITPLILDLALGGGEWSASRLGRFTAGQTPRYSLPRRLEAPELFRN
jgi:hypothetical protein